MNYVLLFVAGAAAANGIPHVVKGITGERWWTPFGWRDGHRVKSSPVLNVLWGALNWLIAFGLFSRTLRVPLTSAHLATVGAGGLLLSLALARSWGRRSESSPR